MSSLMFGYFVTYETSEFISFKSCEILCFSAYAFLCSLGTDRVTRWGGLAPWDPEPLRASPCWTRLHAVWVGGAEEEGWASLPSRHPEELLLHFKPTCDCGLGTTPQHTHLTARWVALGSLCLLHSPGLLSHTQQHFWSTHYTFSFPLKGNECSDYHIDLNFHE